MQTKKKKMMMMMMPIKTITKFPFDTEAVAPNLLSTL